MKRPPLVGPLKCGVSVPAVRDTRPGGPAVNELRSLIDEGRVATIGMIRREFLSGIRNDMTAGRVEPSSGAPPRRS